MITKDESDSTVLYHPPTCWWSPPARPHSNHWLPYLDPSWSRRAGENILWSRYHPVIVGMLDSDFIQFISPRYKTGSELFRWNAVRIESDDDWYYGRKHVSSIHRHLVLRRFHLVFPSASVASTLNTILRVRIGTRSLKSATTNSRIHANKCESNDSNFCSAAECCAPLLPAARRDELKELWILIQSLSSTYFPSKYFKCCNSTTVINVSQIRCNTCGMSRGSSWPLRSISGANH